MKVLYNITFSVDVNIHEKWRKWMMDIHIPEMMSTGCFQEYKMSRVLAGDPQQGVTYAIQYVSPSMNTFMEYRDHHALKLQREYQLIFGDQCAAFRTLMEIHDEGGADN